MSSSPRRRIAALAAVAALALVPTAAFADSASPTPSGAPSGAPSGGSAAPSAVPSDTNTAIPPTSTFTLGFLQDVDSLNPYVGILASSYEAWSVTYDQLVQYSAADFSPVPGLASSWEESADNLTWTYHLRPGVNWSDGVPLTSADVVYTFNRAINGSVESTNFSTYVDNIVSVTAPDPNTVVMKTKVPSPRMLHLSVPILPEHVWKDVTEAQVATYKNEPIVGSGPFIFEQHQTGQFIKFRANPTYWGGAPHIKELVFRIFQSEDTMVAALKKGEVDFVDSIQPTSYNSLKGQKNIAVVNAEYTGFDEIGMNTGAALVSGKPIGNGNPALKDVKLRRAIDTAIDRKTLVDKVLGGYGIAGDSFIPPIYGGQHYTPTDDARPFSLDTANQMLDAAGYTKGTNGIRINPADHGKPLSLRLMGRSDSPTSRNTVQFVAGWLKDIGIDVKVSILDSDNLDTQIANGKYDLFEFGWVDEPDPSYQMSVFECGSRSTEDGGTISAGLSDSFYCNPAYDAISKQQSTTIDPVARTALVKQGEKMIYDDAPYAVTFYYNDLEAYRSDRFTNFTAQPTGKGALLFQWGAYSYLSVTPVADLPKASGGPSTPAKASSSSSPVLWIVIAILVVLVLGGLAVLATRRRTVDDRE
jgi:peptide/nickel transport system substrate-binding protein